MAGIVVEDVWFDSGGYRLKGGPTVRSRRADFPLWFFVTGTRAIKRTWTWLRSWPSAGWLS